MRTFTKTLASVLAGCGLFVTAVQAQTSPASLNEALYSSVCERVQAPLVFSTRDTVFALSLPQDEPAEVYIQLTVGKNGKVKEKLTRVHANHIAGYVAPAFIAATKEMKVNKELLAGMTGKDTSLLLTFPMEYQCVLDTINKARPEEDFPILSFNSLTNSSGILTLKSLGERAKDQEMWVAAYPGMMKEKYQKMPPTRVWYYLAFIKGRPE